MNSYDRAFIPLKPDETLLQNAQKPADYASMFGLGRSGRLVNYTSRPERPGALVDIGHLQQVIAPRGLIA